MKSEELNLLIKEGEGLTVEFKEKYSSKIDKDIVAFANSKGGHLFLGVDDTGKIVGEKLSNKIKADINNLARNCEPSIHIKKVSQLGKVVVVEIVEGDEKPYSCSSGYYRRLDAASQKMNQKELRLLFKDIEATSYEEKIHKDASFNDIAKEKIKAFFKEANIYVRKIIPQDILSSLKLSTKTAIKNAGVLFFAKKPRDLIIQCQMTLVAFKGKDRVHIYDRKDVQDDLLTQFNEAIIFLQKHLNVRSEIKGVNRQDIYELPFEALREAVVNAIIHRDYSMRGTSIMVEVHEDKVVVRNPGGLPEGLSLRSLINISVRRNELIADIFARMDKVERIGSGIKRMRDAMKSFELPYPKIKSDLFFTIEFQRPEYSLAEKAEGGQKGLVDGLVERLVDSQKKILDFIKENPHISKKELSEKIGISSTAIDKNIQSLKKKGLLKRIGSAKGGYWEVIESS